jgi:hypothetical protein
MTVEAAVAILRVAARHRRKVARKKVAVVVSGPRQHNLLKQVARAAELNSLRNSLSVDDTMDSSKSPTLIIPILET